MELKVGMYVRFDWKKQQLPIIIGKITEVHYDEDEKYYFYLTDNGLVIGEDNLVKEPSYNIIDLIEVGDYVNNSKVIKIEEYNNEKYVYVEEMEFCNACNEDENVYYKEEDIKSIVTKEQFSQMEYKVSND